MQALRCMPVAPPWGAATCCPCRRRIPRALAGRSVLTSPRQTASPTSIDFSTRGGFARMLESGAPRATRAFGPAWRWTSTVCARPFFPSPSSPRAITFALTKLVWVQSGPSLSHTDTKHLAYTGEKHEHLERPLWRDAMSQQQGRPAPAQQPGSGRPAPGGRGQGRGGERPASGPEGMSASSHNARG